MERGKKPASKLVVKPANRNIKSGVFFNTCVLMIVKVVCG